MIRSRQQDNFVVLHDIGIYPISLLNNMNIEILNIEILTKKYLKKENKKTLFKNYLQKLSNLYKYR